MRSSATFARRILPARLMLGCAITLLVGTPLRSNTPPPMPPTAEQVAAVHALIESIHPWEAAPSAELEASLTKWLAEQHSDATDIQRRIFELKVRDLYRKAVQSPDALTIAELSDPYRYVSESSVRSLIAFLESPGGYVFKQRFEDLPVRNAGAARQMLPKLPEIFAEAVESAARLEKVNKKKR